MEHTVFAPAVGVTVMAASLLSGREPQEICAELKLPAELLFDPNHRFSHSVLQECWLALSPLNQDFGFFAAQMVGAKSQSLVEYATATAGSSREGMNIFLRYQGLLHDAAAHTVTELPDRVILRIQVKPPLQMPSPLCDYLAGTFFLRTNGRIKEPLAPIAVHLPRREPSLMAKEIFGIEPTYNSQHTEIHWPRKLFESEKVNVDETLFFLLTRKLDDAIKALPSTLPKASTTQKDVLSALRRELRPALAQGDASIEYLSEKLGVSPRTLQRELQERGTSFRDVVEEVRKAIATTLLTEKQASVLEVALSAGFSQTAAFTRAFKRWTGMTPIEYAKQHTA